MKDGERRMSGDGHVKRGTGGWGPSNKPHKNTDRPGPFSYCLFFSGPHLLSSIPLSPFPCPSLLPLHSPVISAFVLCPSFHPVRSRASSCRMVS
jgi:hypothetical protein